MKHLLVVFILAAVAAAQVASVPVERTYVAPLERVRQALQQAGGVSGGKLPGLEGFVASGVEQSDRYQRPYFQYQVETSSTDSTHTLVRVHSKITAWYADTDPAHAEYRALPSSGRLEADLLDRLQDVLGLTAATEPAAADVRSSEASLLEQQLAKVRQQRQAVEAKARDAEDQFAKLNQSIRQPKSLANLAPVKRSGASVMSRMSYSGPVLFRARAEDEFELLAQDGDWIQVRTGPDSTAWILASELSLPNDLSLPKPAPDTTASLAEKINATDPRQSAAGYSVNHEEVNPFAGDWPRLKGKQALFVFVQSRGLVADLSTEGRLLFAKSVFAERYKEAAIAKAPYEGVVVIFMGGQGAVAAATVADIQEWSAGKLSDDAFIKRCSLDPAAQFQRAASAKAAGQ